MIDDIGEIAVDVVAEVIDVAMPESGKRSWRKALISILVSLVMIGMAFWFFS